MEESEDFFYDFEDLAVPLREHVIEANEILSAARDSYQEMQICLSIGKVCSSRAGKRKPMRWKSRNRLRPLF